MKYVYRIITIMISFFILNNTILAEKFSLGDTIDDAYIKKERGTYTHFLQSQIVNIKNTNNYVYCIDPFDRISTSAEYDEHDDKFEKYSNLDEETWNKVVAAASFGYNYGNHTDPIWYSVTQVVIWRMVAEDASINFTDTFNGNIIHDYDDKIDELEELIDDYFNTSEIPKKVTLNYNEYDYYDLNDKYYVLEDDSSVKTSNRRLKLKPDFVGTKDYTLYKGDEDNAILYTNDSYQNLVYVYNEPYVEKTFSLKSVGGKINININYQNEYNNTCISDTVTKYGLYDKDNNLIMEMENSKMSSYLAYGKYYVKQISYSCNYYSDDNIYEINLNKEEVEETINVYQRIRTIQLQHNICIFDNCVREGNVSYKFTDEDNNEFIGTTDENGILDMPLHNTKYTINQLDGNDLYTYTKDYILDLCEYENDYFDVILNGYLYKGDITVIVKDNNDKLIDDAKICLYDENENLIECQFTKKGEVLFKKMIFGNYIVKEESVPDKYILNEEDNKIELTKDIIIKIVNKEKIKEKELKSYKEETEIGSTGEIENPETGDIHIYLLVLIISISIILIKILTKFN